MFQLLKVDRERVLVFTARCYAVERGYATVCRLSDCLSLSENNFTAN